MGQGLQSGRGSYVLLHVSENTAAKAVSQLTTEPMETYSCDDKALAKQRTNMHATDGSRRNSSVVAVTVNLRKQLARAIRALELQPIC